MAEKQLRLYEEPGWSHDERPPKEITDKPELQLAWRGVVISIKSDQISREAAYAMLRRWEELEPQPDQHDAGPHGDLAS